MKKILLSMLAVLSILFLITACGDKPGGNNPPETPSTKTLKQRINEAQDGDVINLGKEDLEIKDSDSYTIEKSITIEDGNLKNATFVVKTDGVVFKNLRNVESVLADEEIEDGDFEISNCYEVQSLYVRGGGANSIHIAATTIKNLQVAKENVRIVLKADDGKVAKVESAVISTNCTLDSEIENTEESSADFGEILIDKSVEKITLKGNTSVEQIIAEVKNEATNETATIHVESKDVKLEVVATEKGTVVEEEKITVSQGVEKPKTVALDWKVYDYQKEQTGTENVTLVNEGSEAIGTVSSTPDEKWKSSMMFGRKFNSSTSYIISFWAKADSERTQTLCIRNYDDELELLNPTIDLTTEYKKYTFQFYLTSEDLNEEIEFQFRLDQGETYIKDCSITPMWIEKNGVCVKKSDFPQWSVWNDTSCRTYPANWIVLQDMAEDSIKVQRFIGRREESFNNWKLQFGYEKEIKKAGKYVFSFRDDKNLTGSINLRNGTTEKDIGSYSDLTGRGDYYIIFDVPETEVNNMFGLYFWTKDMELTDGIEYIQLSNVKLEEFDSNKTYSGKNLGQKQSLIYFESERGKLENWDSMYMYVDIGSQIETFPTLIYEGTDYTFAGWYTDSEFNNPMVYPYTVTDKNLTVYAKWIPNLSNVNQFKGTWHGSYDGNSHWYLFFSDDTMTFYAGELDDISPYTYSGNVATLTEDSRTYDLEIKADGTINYEDTDFSRVEENVENDPFTGVWITYSEEYYTGFMVLQASNGTAFQVIDGEIETSDLTYTVSENIVTINDSVQFEISDNSFVLYGDTFYRAYDVDFSKIDEFWPSTIIDETNFTTNNPSISVTKSDTEVMIENPNAATGSEWDYYVTAVQEFDMNANQNYKVSIEAKTDTEQEIMFRITDSIRTGSHVQIKKTVGTDWQTIEFETGSWTADWLAQFIVYVGTTDVVYLRNLKVEGVNTNLLPVTEYNNSVISERSENGFTVEITNTSEWMKIPGQKAESGNLYKITFDASATAETILNFSVKASQGKYADSWNKQVISSTPTNYTLYVPHVGSDLETEYDFMDIGFGSSAASTITISNFTVESVPMEEKPHVLFALKGITTPWNQFMGYLGSGQNITIPAGESFEVFAQIGVENFDKWDVVSELRYVTGAEILDISTNESGRPVITNNTVIDREFMLWIYHDYRIIIDEPQTYSVTFDLNDGTFNGSSSNVTLDVSNLLSVKPEKDGCSFLGWVDADGNIVSEIQSGITVYAKWSNNLELFANGDIVGDFSVVQDKNGELVYSDYAGIPFTSEGDGIYSATFIYDSSYMKGWGSPSGTCAFKARTVANSWDGTSYGIADSANQPVINGDAVSCAAVKDSNIVVSGFVDGTAYKITFICAQDGTVSLKVEETETYTMTISARPITQGYTDVPKGYIVDLSSMEAGTGYVILGWFTDENFTEPVEFPYTVNSDVTFYAKITSIQVCNVIFYGVDTAIYPDLTFNYGDTINEDDLPVMTGLPEDYTFDGWYLDYGKTQKLTYPYTITSDIGLYPGFTQN